MPQKKSQLRKLGPYSSDQTISAIAGCPFTNFGPCTTFKCAFFVAVPPELTERECVIRSTYFLQMTHNVVLESEFLKTHRDPNNYAIPTSIVRVAESLIGAVDYLEGLANHPKTSPALRRQLKALRETLYRRLKTFAGVP